MKAMAIIIGVLVVLASAVCAAETAGTSTTTTNPKVTLDAKDMPIDQALAEMAKQAGVQIVCDSGVKGTVTGRFESIELEKLLGVITKTNELAWQKVYIPQAQDDRKPTLEQIKARAEAISAMIGGPIAVVDPTTGKQKVFVEQDTTAPSVDPEKLGLKPVYLVTKQKTEAKPSTTAGNQDTAKRFESLQTERMALLASMTPEERINALQQEIIMMMNMDPTVRGQIMIDQMRARHDMPPELREKYHQMMHDTFRTLREQGQLPNDLHWQGGDHGNRGGHDRRGG